jgi:hypothetical protein
MSTPSQVLQVVSLAVDLIQATTALSGEVHKVSQVIAARIASGRKEWTQEELDALQADLQAAKSDAHRALDAMAEDAAKIGLTYDPLK